MSVKSILFSVIFLLSTIQYLHSQDVRGTNWGMSPSEVQQAEYPLNGIIEKWDGKISITYENIDVGTTVRKADIVYFFNSSSKLDKVTFMIKKSNYDKNDNYSLSYKFNVLSPFYNTMIRKGYKKDSKGWYLNFSTYSEAFNNCVGGKKYSIDADDLNSIYSCALSHRSNWDNTLNLTFVNDSTKASLSFSLVENTSEYAVHKKMFGWVIFESLNTANDSF